MDGLTQLALTLLAGLTIFLARRWYAMLRPSPDQDITVYLTTPCSSKHEAAHWIITRGCFAGYDDDNACWYIQLERRRLPLPTPILVKLITEYPITLDENSSLIVYEP